MTVSDVVRTVLDDFGKLPARVVRPPTFMEIAGYPHYENACSNILAFFLDPAEPHGLGTLVLDALMGAGERTAPDERVGGNVSVEREVHTNVGNRIDLLIESDTHAVLVENKIHASVDNPLSDYAAFLDGRTPKGCSKHKLLLTILPTHEGREWGFTNITYADFVYRIRSSLGHHVSEADTRYLTFLLDFLNTLENLRKETRMDREFVKLLAERGEDVKSLLVDLKSFRAELRQKVHDLQALIDANRYRSVEGQGLWRGDTATLSDNLYYMIRVAEDLLVGIDARVDPNGWEIQIFARDKGDPAKLRDLLRRLEVPFKEKERFIHSHRFAYDEALDSMRLVLQDLVDKLARANTEAVSSHNRW